MLVHHDSTRTYAEAASAAAEDMRGKMNKLIERGRLQAGDVLAAVERDIPEDAVVSSRVLEFGANGHVSVAWPAREHVALHEHAMFQACERFGMPTRYARELMERGDWGRQLIAENLTALNHHRPARYLVRTVRDEVRGFLSDSFRRLDTRPIIEAFCTAAAKIGAVPVEGTSLDTKVNIKALLPRIFEPVPNEVVCFGVTFSNSNFGDGALSVRVFILRLWCTNYAITDEALRQVHLGGRLPDDITFSDRTYRLDTQRSASMVSDLLTHELSPQRVNEVCALIQRANEEKIEAHAVKSFLAKHLNQSEAKAVSEAFASADVENLPPGQTSWRLSNALSWIAGKEEVGPRRRLELQQVAALALPGGAALHA